MIISKKTLPNSIFIKLPISIQYSSQNDFDVDILDISIRVEIYNFLNNLPLSTYQDTTQIFDLKFDLSNTNNLQIITNKVDMLKDYFITYLKTSKGSYPFDPTIGCRIPEYLKLKENSLKSELIRNELTNIISSINISYDAKLLLTEFELIVDSNMIANIYITVVFDDGSSLNSVLNTN